MQDVHATLRTLRQHSTFGGAVLDLDIPTVQLLIDKADALYYRTGKDGGRSLVSDDEYDVLKGHLRNLDPDDLRLTRVGMQYDPSEIGNKVKHTIPMGSLDNTDDGILGYNPWLESTRNKLQEAITDRQISGINILASLKVDGGSICATYKGGKLVRVATRGNGEYGEDVTANAVNFRHLPPIISYPIDIEVRGEAILYKQDFEKVCTSIPVEERSNPRNVGNGIIGRHDGTDSEYIRFLAFNLYVGDGPMAYSTEEEKFLALKELGFTPVPHQLCKSVSEFEAFYNSVVGSRDKLPFEIDGIVVVVNNLEFQNVFVTDDVKTLLRPKYARAVKFPHKSNVTVLEGVEVTVGHTRAIIPTAKLKTVRIGGVNVDSALLNNYDEINRLGVAIGDEVEVVLAGDIIPKIIRCVNQSPTRTPILEPMSCPECGSNTSRLCRGKPGAVTYCSNVRCSAAVFAKLDHWIGTSKKGVGILDIGDTMIKALWKQGILSDPADLYLLTVDQLKDVVLEKGGKIGQSRAAKIVTNIAAKKHLSLSMFLGSLGIDLLGRRRVDILREAAKGQLDKLDDWLDLNKLRTIQLPGFGDTIRSSVVSGIEENTPLINKMLANGVTVGVKEVELVDNPTPVDAVGGMRIAEDVASISALDKPFAGLSFCFTGTRENIGDVERLGGIIKSGISKGLDFLVQLDPMSASNKTKKAEEYGTQIISLDYLRRAIRGEVTLAKAVVV